MQKAHLEQWRLLHADGGCLIIGVVFGHPLIKDSRNLLSSEVVGTDFDNSWVVTKNTKYTLGKPLPENEPPDSEFVTMFRERFIKNARRAGVDLTPDEMAAADRYIANMLYGEIDGSH